jgi:formylglycine-generating enzyme required for sulfatase activity
MVTVPAGPFLMGSPEEVGGADEHPQRTVHVKAFAIDQTEVTNARYLRFVKETGHKPPPNPYEEGRLSATPMIADLPVVQVTWHDAADYCQWAGKRLPTEAEWEKAARGTDGRIFPWGNGEPTPQHTNFNREWEGVGTLRPVGSFPAGRSPFDLDDMAGNAREWVQDWYDPEYYKAAPDRDPRGPEQGILKVIRGGSWHHGSNDIRAAVRGKGGFALKTDGTGFRCARDAQAPLPESGRTQ